MKKHLLFLLLCLVAAQTPADTLRSDTAMARFLERSGIKITTNNRLVLLHSGAEKFKDMFTAIRQAKHSVHLEYFNFRNDSIAKALFDILAERAAAGVEVRALFDAFGNASNNRPLKNNHIRSLRAKGIEIYKFDPLRFPWINHVFSRDHRKIVVIDGQIAYTGGMNVADYYINGTPQVGTWRDMHMRIEGDAVGELQTIFLQMWNKVSGQHISGAQYYPGTKNNAAGNGFAGLIPDTCATAGKKHLAIVNREPHKSPKVVRRTFVEAIDAANSLIQIVNPYFTLNHNIRKALEKAIKRGVRVEIMVSEASDIPITPRIVDYTARSLMKKGANVYYYKGGFHHSKVMTVDSLFSYAGSANLNSRSLAWDYECNVVILDRSTTAELMSVFENDKRIHCVPLTDEYWKNRKKWKNVQGWLFHFLRPFVMNGNQDESIAPTLPVN